MALIDDYPAELFTAPNQLQKNRNDGAFHSAFQKIDKFLIDNVDAGKNEFVRRARAKLIADVDDAAAARIERDVTRSRPGTQRQGNDVAGAEVIVDQTRDWQIGQHVAV